MRNLMLGGLIALIALGGCGKKEFPQPDTNAPLRIVNLSINKEVSILNMKFTIVGGYGNVGFQIDRAVLDTVCNCLTPWQRHLEQEPLPNRRGVEQVRNVKLSYKRDFAFRIRAVDSAGNLSPWSKPVQARADDPNK